MVRTLAVACVLMTGCSFAFVDGPSVAMVRHEVPATCTTSRTLPATDLVIGAAMGAAIFATIYGAIDSFNDDADPGAQFERPWGPALIGAFLVSSPWLISAAVGFSDTSECRKVGPPRTP